MTTVRQPAGAVPPYGHLTTGLLITAGYVAAAQIGFRLAFVAEQITTVWAPTGIAIAALLLCGIRLWPAIWIGALIANASSAAPLWTAFVLATGNTLEAVAAVWLLQMLWRREIGFGRVSDVLGFVLIAAVGCTTISATIGVLTLCAAAVQPWERFGALWFDWWLGDALGATVVAPAIVTVVRRRPWSAADVAKATVYVVCAATVTHLIFGQVFGVRGHPLEYLVFPIAIVAAVMHGPAMTCLSVLTVSAVSIWHTVHGAGPFAGPPVHQSLVLLQAFMGVLAVTALLLAAAVAERQMTQLRERDAAAGLRQREEMLRLAQRAGGVATFEWDFQNQTAQCSAEFFRIFGLPARDGVISAAEWGRFVHPEDRERMAAHLARAIRGDEPAAADYRIHAADGNVRWLSYAGRLQTTLQGERMLGTVVDITDRKRLEAELRHHASEVERILIARVDAEAALRDSRDVLSLAMRGGSMGAWSRNLITNEVWWSHELEEIVGLEAGAFNRTETGFFAFVHEDDRRAVREAVDHAVRDGSDYIVEFRFQHGNGEWRWMEGRGRAVYAADGTPRTLYGIGIDITERKRSEMALREAKAAAESANQLKDQFLATLSHELRTPLNAILGYARMLQTNAIAPEKRQHAMDVIERNAVAQHQLVEELLDMSRITTGKVRLDPLPVPVIDVLNEAIEGIKPAADAKGISLNVQLDPSATVSADSTRLQQVFWNILTNAVKFTEHGGRIAVTVDRLAAECEIRISDTGAGIPREFLPHMFEPFRQADARADRGHGGLGLGLAIARQLAELHGGTIQASSEGSGKGSTFTIRLPCVDAGRADAASEEV